MAKFHVIFNTASKPGRGEEYGEWCRTQHFPDLMRIPGVVSAKRFKVLSKDAEDRTHFVAIVEVECDDPKDVMREIGRRYGTPEMPRHDCYDPATVSVSLTELEREWVSAD